jgi:hypothetical protein
MPKRIYSYQYLNAVADNAAIVVPPVPSTDLLEVSRNGIGMLRSGGGTETVTTNVIQFNRLSEGAGSAVAGKYIIPTSTVNTLTTRTVTYEIGPTITAGDVYVFKLNAFLSTSYVVLGGDTVTDVRDGLQAAVDGYSWGGTVTCSAVSTNRFSVTAPISMIFTYFIVYGEVYLYQIGYYVVLSGKQYLVTKSESFTAYPIIASPEPSYAFNALTLMPSGLIAYINNPSYAQVDFYETGFGSTDITGVSTAAAIGQGKYFYDEATQTLTFSEPLQPGEYIKMLYK